MKGCLAVGQPFLFRKTNKGQPVIAGNTPLLVG
jgi:hypothetical protein